MLRIAMSILLLAGAGSVGWDSDTWNQWRGPQRDGHADWFGRVVEWPERPSVVWSVDVGLGHASPVTDGTRVCLHARQGGDEVAACYSVESGELLWSSAYPVRFKAAMGGGHHGPGPKSTPVLTDDGKLVTFGITSVLSAFDAESGEVLWRLDFADEVGDAWPRWGTSYSPLALEGDIVVQYGRGRGALVRVDGSSGEIVWSIDGDGSAYSSPILARFDSVVQIVTASNEELMGVDVDGNVLWRTPHPSTIMHQGIATPAVAGDLLIVSTGKKPLRALRVERSGATWKLTEVWQRDDIQLEMGSVVAIGDRICGVWKRKKGQAFCLSAAQGTTIWQSLPRFSEHASLIVVPGAVLFQLADGELVAVDSEAAEYTELARFGSADSEVWAHPAPLPEGRLLIKSYDRLTLIALD